jgi:hypothetical protein
MITVREVAHNICLFRLFGKKIGALEVAVHELDLRILFRYLSALFAGSDKSCDLVIWVRFRNGVKSIASNIPSGASSAGRSVSGPSALQRTYMKIFVIVLVFSIWFVLMDVCF